MISKRELITTSITITALITLNTVNLRFNILIKSIATTKLIDAITTLLISIFLMALYK